MDPVVGVVAKLRSPHRVFPTSQCMTLIDTSIQRPCRHHPAFFFSRNSVSLDCAYATVAVNPSQSDPYNVNMTVHVFWGLRLCPCRDSQVTINESDVLDRSLQHPNIGDGGYIPMTTKGPPVLRVVTGLSTRYGTQTKSTEVRYHVVR